MVMTERYGVPSTKIIALMKYLQTPLQQIQEGDKILVMTDDAMDPLVWQSFMAVVNAKGGSPALCLFPKLPYHCCDPHPAAIEAAKACNGVAALTTTCMNSGTPGLRSIRKAGRIPIWLMEENTVEILTEGGGTATWDDLKEMVELHKRIGAIYDRGKKIRLLSEYGTDFTADISGYPKDFHFNRAAKLPFQRDGQHLGGGTWPYGEIHVEPLPGTANGTVVWDTTAHYPAGIWKDPVKLTIKDGTGRQYQRRSRSPADQRLLGKIRRRRLIFRGRRDGTGKQQEMSTAGRHYAQRQEALRLVAFWHRHRAGSLYLYRRSKQARVQHPSIRGHHRSGHSDRGRQYRRLRER